MVAAELITARPKVHLAHCDSDLALVERLVAGLQHDGRFELFISSDKTPLQRTWKARFGDSIAAADTVLLVLSPEAVRSEVVIWQLEKAHELSKRTIPIIGKYVHYGDLPVQLDGAKQLRLDEDRLFSSNLASLINSLLANAEWIHKHTVLYARARAWEDAGRADQQLLTSAQTAAAKTWTFERPDNAPKPTELHMSFIEASEMANAAGESGAPAPQIRSDNTRAPVHSQFEKKRARRRLKPAVASGPDGDFKFNGELADPAATAIADLEAEASQPDWGLRKLDAIRSRQGPSPLQVVLGCSLVLLAGVAVWQAVFDVRQPPKAVEQVMVQSQPRTELAERLFLAQSNRIEQAVDRVDCLLSQGSEKKASCIDDLSRSGNQARISSSGDFDQ